jgi:TolB protein
MRNISLVFLFLASAAVPAFAQRDIGSVEVVAAGKTLPVRVSADNYALNALALQAFGAHGRYHLVAAGYLFDIRFSLVGPAQVRVDVARGADVWSETVAGTSQRNALLRAADAAVVRTNGLGLRGFFASKLVFIGERTGHQEVYAGDLFFGEVRQITNDRAIALRPRWSPDGQRVLYTSYYHSGFPDIFAMDLSSYQRMSFVSFQGTNMGARYSPDGSRVAMVLTGEGSPEIYVSNAEGRAVSRRTRFESVKASPCWSPDGTRIVFASGTPSPQLYMMSASGGSIGRITFGISSYCAEPDWSRGNPDKIAFTAYAHGSYQIAVLSLSTHESQVVSHAPFDGIEPCWLADGRHLVYTARTRSTSRVCILDTETGKSVPVSPAGFGPSLQADVWTPNY